jgi:Uma2 family endonuclease
MPVKAHKPWTQQEFLAWAEAQNSRYEFDGFRPVAMTGGTVRHSRMVRNLSTALDSRLQGHKCESLGPEAGIATVGSTVRFPDGLVTCSEQDPNSRLVVDPVVVFEIRSPSTAREDLFVKPGEYAAIPSMRRHVMLESRSVGAMVLERTAPGEAWRHSSLANIDDILKIPEIGLEIPLSEFYRGVSFPSEEDSSAD